jgi:hypothetical protein
MADGCVITLAVPPEALARLRTAERRQRAETKARGLPAEPVSVEGLLLLQRNLCGCKCGEPLDFAAVWTPKDTPPGFPVIAHRLARGSKGGHVVGNVFIDRFACNKRDAGPDTSGAASVKRFTPDFSRKDEPQLVETRRSEAPSKWQSAGFRKSATMKRTISGKVVPR